MSKFISAVVCLFCACGVSADDRLYFLSIGYFYWREYQPSGQSYVREDGMRATLGLELRRPLSEVLTLTYVGTLYGTLNWHRADDPTRIAIPSGSESTLGGQIGTRQSVRLVANNFFGYSNLRPYAGVAYDIWYRPLEYYEIWQIPSVEAGVGIDPSFCTGCLLEVGLVQTIDARNLIQTTHSPWNGDSDTSLRLGNSLTASVAFEIPYTRDDRLRFQFAGYRFGQSDCVPLSSGICVYQPRTTTYLLSVAWTRSF